MGNKNNVKSKITVSKYEINEHFVLQERGYPNIFLDSPYLVTRKLYLKPFC